MFAHENAAEYEESYRVKYQRADALEKKLLKKLLTTQLSEGGRVLEVGCGTAHFTKWLEALGFESYGVDSSTSMLTEAKKQWVNNRLVKCDAAHLPFTAKSFDAGAFITSLEFMATPEAAIKEAVRVSKKAVILGLLNKYSVSTLKKTVRAATKKSRYYSQAHFYSKREIQNMLSRCEIPYRKITTSTTLFPKVVGEAESSVFPFGGFLGMAIELRDNH